ncbi:MAG: ABC transporter permease [Acidobacteriota bacterium]
MWGYTARRLLAVLPLLWFIWTITFIVGRLLPGDPVDLYRSPHISARAVEHLRHVYGLDDPLPLQYMKQLTATLTGQEILSTSQGRPVWTIIRESVGPTLLLTGLALAGQFLLGLALGLGSALSRDGPVDHAISGIALFLYSIPSFLLGVQLILLFSAKLGWFPSSHMHSVRAGASSPWQQPADLLRHLFLPLLTLTLGSAAMTIRHVRSSLLEVSHMEFVKAARGRGLPEWRVTLRHILRNALLPLVNIVGLELPFLLSGALVAYDAIMSRDYPVIQATTLLTACLAVLGSLLADLLTAAVDPRVRLQEKNP